jgi:hypothetical protein
LIGWILIFALLFIIAVLLWVIWLEAFPNEGRRQRDKRFETYFLKDMKENYPCFYRFEDTNDLGITNYRCRYGAFDMRYLPKTIDPIIDCVNCSQWKRKSPCTDTRTRRVYRKRR